MGLFVARTQMTDDDKDKIHFIYEAEIEDSPLQPLIDEIARQLVEPAIPTNLHYTLSRGDFRSEPGALDHCTIDMMSTTSSSWICRTLPQRISS
jgi:hypothetical protein